MGKKSAVEMTGIGGHEFILDFSCSSAMLDKCEGENASETAPCSAVLRSSGSGLNIRQTGAEVAASTSQGPIDGDFVGMT
jgi:hypothetical protein